jgi:CIC family chloride channel protein
VAPDPTVPPVVARHGVFHTSLRGFLDELSGNQKAFWILVFATGVASGLGASLLVGMLSAVQGLAWPAAPTFLAAVQAASPQRRVLVLASTGALIALVSLLLRRPLGGHGTAGIIEAIWFKEGYYSFSRAMLRGFMAIVAVGLGAPLGREGALISTGAGFGSWLARRTHLSPEQRRMLTACGAASGIAAAYNVPLGGAVFGLEVLLGSFALELLGPIVVSCVTATVISRVLVESHPAYVIPAYNLGKPHELLNVALMAPVFGVASALYVKTVEGLAILADRTPRRLHEALPFVVLTLVGVAAVWSPELLGNGYDTVNAALLGQLPWRWLIVLPLLKMLLTAGSSAAGVPGGLFTPSLFYGALVGGALGAGLDALWPGTAPAGAYALIGMAAVLAGTTHAAVTAVLMIFEMTGNYGMMLPLMLACVIATAVSRRLEGNSLYTGVLRRRNVVPPAAPRPAWLQ